jgi:hypothetical protein
MWKVIWQDRPGSLVGLDTKAKRERHSLLSDKKRMWSDLDVIGDVEPIFIEPPSDLRESIQPDLRSDPVFDLASYFHLFLPSKEQALVLLRRLKADGHVLKTQALAFDQPTPNLIKEQGYLKPAPEEVNAFYAWGIPGGTGQVTKIVDVENG